MKHPLILLILTLLLTGCAAQNPPVEATVPATTVTQPTEASSEPNFSMEARTEGSLCTYGPSQTIQGILPLGNDLLIFTGETNTVLFLLDMNTMTVVAAHEPGFLLLPENATFQKLASGFSYFHGQNQETVILDSHLQEIGRLSAPDGLAGFPLLSMDGRTLFYCTADAIRALDLDSGISRILKEAAYPVQGLSGLLLKDTVLQVSITDTDGSWSTLFLSSDTGQLLQQCSGNVLPQVGENSYFLKPAEGFGSLLFGQIDGPVQTFQPCFHDADAFFLPDTNRVVTAAFESDHIILDLYDLESGIRTAALPLSPALFPRTMAETADGRIWFLCEEDASLYCWNPADSLVADDAIYIGGFYTRQEPDYDGLAACSLYAQDLSETYGMNILIYKDAVAVEPWDYHLEYEHQADILLRELEALDHRLEQFPEGFLETLTEKFTGFNICLVRSAIGSPESGSLEDVNGIQFMVDFDAYIVLSTSHDTEYALYHELSHLMETVVLTESTAYDRWDNLNPEGFQYDNDYVSNQTRDGSLWLKPGSEYFIDTYSMSYPKEDRARLFEYAMTQGHEALFSSPNLQRKLRHMCAGIRDAFDLKKDSENFPWEQYLLESLT